MTQDRPILEYQSPGTVMPPPGGNCTFTFAPPPILGDLIIEGAVVLLFGGGAMTLAAFGAQQLWQRWSWETLLLFLSFIAACMLIASSNWGHLRNGMRFGALPVKLTISDDQLLMSNPARWGLKMHAVPLEQIRRCYTEFGGWSFKARTIHRINVQVHGRGTIELAVVSTDRKSVDEAVAAISARLPSTAGRK